MDGMLVKVITGLALGLDTIVPGGVATAETYAEPSAQQVAWRECDCGRYH